MITFDPRSEKNIASLTPATQIAARAFLDACINKVELPIGWTVKIISGLRTYTEQDALYAQGRTVPGPIVTNAPAGYSNHNFGIAFDIGIFDANGGYIDDTMPEAKVSPYYRAFAPVGRALGLIWGGDWASIDDEPHYEIEPSWAAGMSENQKLAQLRQMAEDGTAIA